MASSNVVFHVDTAAYQAALLRMAGTAGSSQAGREAES
jgi:hypothetical protein